MNTNIKEVMITLLSLMAPVWTTDLHLVFILQVMTLITLINLKKRMES